MPCVVAGALERYAPTDLTRKPREADSEGACKGSDEERKSQGVPGRRMRRRVQAETGGPRGHGSQGTSSASEGELSVHTRGSQARRRICETEAATTGSKARRRDDDDDQCGGDDGRARLRDGEPQT